MALLKDGKFNEIAKSVSNKITDLLECEPIAGVLSHAGADRVKAYVEGELIKLAGNVNVNPALNIKDHQVPVIAEHLIDNYKWESLEDFTLCFRRASSGLYGEIFRLDGAVIGQWMNRYLDEKYDALEQKKKKEAEQEKKPVQRGFTDHASKCIDQILANLGAVKPEEDNAKVNEYERFKLERQSRQISDAELRKKSEQTKEFQRLALVQKYPEATPERIEEILNTDEYKKFRRF